MENIKQIVLWGHKLHSHTHSYIHNGFNIAFQHLGYKTLWLDNSDDISQINFSNSLFITEGQVDAKIPVLQDCYYVLHNCSMEKYLKLPEKNYFILQVYTNDVVNKHKANEIDKSTLTFYKDKTLYMPWATDLLPEEINENIEKVKNGELRNPEKIVSFVGSMTLPWLQVNDFCMKNNIKFICYGGNSNNLSLKDNITLTQKSLLAPAFQDTWQCSNGYIPCRIFKNISYGKMGITNNITVYELYNKEIIFNHSIDYALKTGLEFEKSYNKELLIHLMEVTRDKHTYLNRITQIFNVFKGLNDVKN
jgi:hypothetical protein